MLYTQTPHYVSVYVLPYIMQSAKIAEGLEGASGPAAAPAAADPPAARGGM